MINFQSLPPDVAEPTSSATSRENGARAHSGEMEIASLRRRLLSAVSVPALDPDSNAFTKAPPSFNARQLAAICGLSFQQIYRRLAVVESLGLPPGQADGPKDRIFLQSEAFAWAEAQGKRHRRSEGVRGVVIAVGPSPAGSGKSTLAATLAQGLNLKGYKVLAVDLDQQATLTRLLGVDPCRVDVTCTFTPLALEPGADDSSRFMLDSLRESYWSGIDLMAGGCDLCRADLALQTRFMAAQGSGQLFNPFEVLSIGLDQGIADEYDFVIIDPPSGVSFTAMNAFCAADALLVPVVPEEMQLLGTEKVFKAFEELFALSEQLAYKPKTFSWIGIVPAWVSPETETALQLASCIRSVFSGYAVHPMLPFMQTREAGPLATIYDISKFVGRYKHLADVRLQTDALVADIEEKATRHCWTAGQGI